MGGAGGGVLEEVYMVAICSESGGEGGGGSIITEAGRHESSPDSVSREMRGALSEQRELFATVVFWTLSLCLCSP